MQTKAKILLVLFFLISPFQNIYNQQRNLDTTKFFQRFDSTHLKILLNEKNSIRNNFSLSLKLKVLELNNEITLFYSQRYSDIYKKIYGVDLSPKGDIDKNLIVALQRTLQKEDETISAIRKYLGISQDIFAVILALVHLATYY
jgi:hypothetical protein